MVQKIDYPNHGGGGSGPNPRIETGPVQFGDDWPGLFIRGDNALAIALSISVLMERVAPMAENNPTLRLALSGVTELYELITKEVIH